jgi:peroxiredoxin
MDEPNSLSESSAADTPSTAATVDVVAIAADTASMTNAAPHTGGNRIGLLLLLIGALVFGAGAALLVLQPGASTPQRAVSSVSIGSGAGVREGRPAPVFELKTLDGARALSLSELKGKRVLLNFWASWCPPCVAETPALVDAYTTLNDPTIEFVGIGLTDDLANLKAFAANNKIPYLLVADPEGRVGDAYGIRGMPTTLLIDEAGVVQKIWIGPVDKPQILAAFKR